MSFWLPIDFDTEKKQESHQRGSGPAQRQYLELLQNHLNFNRMQLSKQFCNVSSEFNAF